MDTKKLRQKILDLAIRGKLVPQDPNDEPASVLLERIRAEKERLIAEGKIKRPKKSRASSCLSHYQNFEPPFEIPDSWEWVQVNDITTTILYGVSESAKSQGEYKLLRITDIQDNSVKWANVPYTDFDKNKATQYILQNGDIVFARTGATVGKSYLVESVPSNSIYASYLIRIRTNEEILPEYLKIFFESTFYWQQIFEGAVGIGQPNVNGTSLGLLWLPIPPRNEQRRIVSNTQDFTLNVISMEYSKKAINESITQLKSKILELAMQGKLVPQDPADEPAADMLKRINPKAKIITDNPHSWNIPQGWVIANLKELIYSPSSKQFQILQSQIKQDGLIPVISQSSNFIEGYSENVDKAFHPNNGIVIFGDHTKNVKFFSGSFIIGADGVKLIDWDFDKRFLFHLITYVSEKIPNKGYSRHFQYLLPYVIGLPPLEEQKRIVAKIEELYSVLDKIEASLQS